MGFMGGGGGNGVQLTRGPTFDASPVLIHTGTVQFLDLRRPAGL